MSARFSFRKIVARSALDDFFLMKNVIVQHLLQREGARNTVHQCEHIAAKADLQLSMLKKFIQNDLRDRILFQVDDDIDTRTIRSVMNA